MCDIAPDFRKFISKLPVCSLMAMRNHLEESGNKSEAVKLATLDLSIEILRRKWGVSGSVNKKEAH